MKFPKQRRFYRKERQTHPDLKSYYQIEKYQLLDADSSFLLCVDQQTWELIYSLIEPKYDARWQRFNDALNKNQRIKSDEDKQFVYQLWERLQHQLADTMCVSKLSDSIDNINVTLKYILAAKTDGVARDFLHDPGNPQRTADYFGVPIEDVPQGDGSGAVWSDISWPNLVETFDQFQAAQRQFVEEVPSTQIKKGNWSSKSMADMAYDNWYFTPTITSAEGVNLDGEVKIGNADMMADHLYRIDLAQRHLVATQTRSGEVKVNLPDEPHIIGPLSGMRIGLYDAFNFVNSSTLSYLGNISVVSTIQQMVQRSSFGKLVSSLSNYLPRVYAEPSVFTNGARHPDDPAQFSGRAAAPEHFDWLAKSTSETLRAGSYPDIMVTELPTVTTPEIPPIDGILPTGLPSTRINLLPVGNSGRITIPGSHGKGLASMFKLKEPDRIISDPFGWGGSLQFEDGRIYVTLPSLISGLPVLNWFLSGRIQIYPPKRTGFTIAETFSGENIASVMDSALRLRKANVNTDSATEQDRKNSLWNLINPQLKGSAETETVNMVDLVLNSFNLRPDHPAKKDANTLTHAEILNSKQFDPDIDVTVDAPTVNVTNTVPVPDVTVNVEPYDDAKLISAINSLMSAGQADTVTIEKAIDRLAQATLEKEIVQMVNTSTGVQTYKSDCCPDLSQLPRPEQPDKVDKPNEPNKSTNSKDLYTLPDDEENKDPCLPVNTSWYIDVLEFFVYWINKLEETFGADIAKWAVMPVLSTLALIPGVSGTLAGLGLIATPVPGDELFVTVAGWAITAYIIYIYLKLGVEGLRIAVDWVKYDYILWAALECGESTLGWDDLWDILKLGLDKYLDTLDIKRIERTGKTLDEVKHYLKEALKQLYSKDVKRLPGKKRLK